MEHSLPSELPSDIENETSEQQQREFELPAEGSFLQALDQVEKVFEALDQPPRDLADEIEVLGQQARELAQNVETSRLQTLEQSDKEIESLEQQARDLATSVEVSRRVLERTAQLEAANKELDSFSYSVSHDLRAPLRAIDGFSRILLEDYSDSLVAEAKDFLQKVRENTKQMGKLVDDLLAFAHLGRQPLNKHLVEPEKLVQHCLEEMTKDQQDRKIEVVFGDLPPCQADPALLKQVWTNLISNALKYTRKQETARIEIGCRIEPRLTDINGKSVSGEGTEPEVAYFVKDNGAGFDMKYVNKLFGVFQRLHRATEYEGTGVGLAIVHRIVLRHGGRIWADAAPNQGATFYFTLN